MKNFFLGLFLATVLVSVGYWIVSRQDAAQQPQAPQKAGQKYHCPMHPNYISDKPGDCPICGMRLVPIEAGVAPSATPGGTPAPSAIAANAATQKRTILYYTDAMNPGSRYDKPGKAPDGMDLEPVYAEEKPGETGSTVRGYAPVRIAADRLQLMGVTLSKAKVMDLEESIHTVGMVTADETRTHHIHTKFEGYIENLYVNYIGEHVDEHQPLFSIYSPELEATQREYLMALKARDQLGVSGMQAQLPGIDLVGAARRRLALWDISADQLALIEKTREPIRALTMYSPVSGNISAKSAVQGNRVTPADTLYDIVDLSTVWIMADLYEANLPFVKVGDVANITLSYHPGSVWQGRISNINPALDEKSRTVKARIALENPSGYLKPDMYVEAVLHGRLGRGVVVPDSAVMATGEREIVFVAKGDGLFEPREVKTGIKVRGFYEIKSGIADGESVVTGANFLLDSESKLKAAISGSAEAKK
ncbi:MAG: efflux RND transporter periplasmic adaptor subunit [Acidobacteriota bacterium]|jgi:RND family efflux transporter MFP subunit